MRRLEARYADAAALWPRRHGETVVVKAPVELLVDSATAWAPLNGTVVSAPYREIRPTAIRC